MPARPSDIPAPATPPAGSPFRDTPLAQRLPIALLVAAMAAIYLLMPYRGLDADAANYAIMGENLLKYRLPPTLAMGQNYLFSVTPYLHALLRVLLPWFAPPLVFSLAGSLLSLGGLWLVYESLLIAERRAGGAPLLAGAVFCVLIAASPTYVLEMATNSGLEVSLFLLGILLFCASRSDIGRAGAAAHFVLAAGVVYATYSRPQIALYGLMVLPLLLRAGWSRSRLLPLALGGLAGYAPMLLHKVFVAPKWPFTGHTPLELARTMAEFWPGLQRMAGDILPIIFSADRDHPLYTVAVVLWVGVAIAAIGGFGGRRPLSGVDRVLALGTLLVLLVMLAFPALSAFPAQRRYCLHTLLAAAWFGGIAVSGGNLLRRAVPLLAAALALLSAPRWAEGIVAGWDNDQSARRTVAELIPELERTGGVFITDYWDAYRLAFLAGDRLKIEAYPWQYVRSYGLLTPADLAGKVSWLVKSGHGNNTHQHLEEEVGEPPVREMLTTELKSQYFGRGAELWEFRDPALVEPMMTRYHPLYFRTKYPPGLEPLLAAVPGGAGKEPAP